MKEAFISIDRFLSTKQGEVELHTLRKEDKGCITYYFEKITKKKIFIGRNSGSTANVVLLTDDKIYVANAGDSRSILVRKNEVVELSKDHKPELKSEKARIEKCGGRVTANNRING